jgi:hypothetical protein
VIQILQDQQPLLDDAVALLALHVGDEAHAAGIVLVPGVVKALRLGNVGLVHGFTLLIPRAALIERNPPSQVM